MKHEELKSTECGWAELYVLAGGTPEENAAFEAHMRGCARCRKEVETAQETLNDLEKPTEPRAEVQKRLRERLKEKKGTVFSAMGIFASRTTAMEWSAAGMPGVWIKKLNEDRERRVGTSLVKLEAGVRFPAHRHAGVEEVWVAEGDLHLKEAVLVAGDYCRAEPGTLHSSSFTENGCVLLVMSSLDDEMMEA